MNMDRRRGAVGANPPPHEKLFQKLTVMVSNEFKTPTCPPPPPGKVEKVKPPLLENSLLTPSKKF